jgi:DNA-binding response OmpR family regulator
MTQSILIVEDDENLSLVLQDNLSEQGYQVDVAATGTEARSLADSKSFDLIVLDIMLPDTDGYQLCREFRAGAQKDAMILMLTARSLEDDIVQGFEVGADDYLTKPYKLREFLLRIKALLRRQNNLSPTSIQFGRVRVDTESRQVYLDNDEEIPLTKKEFDLLEYFVINRNRALTRGQILDKVWGASIIVEERTVDNFVSNIKKKLQWTEDENFRIVSLRGIGYRMEIDEQS